jgi:uncharacterized protein YbaP (TraB family)
MKNRNLLRLPRLGAALLSLVLAGITHTARADDAPAACPPMAKQITAEQITAGMKYGADRGFLWRITKSGRSSYLYGTIHVAKMEWMFPGLGIQDAMDASDVVALELDPLDQSVMQKIAEKMKPDPASAIPAALTERLKKQMKAECLPEELSNFLSPEMLASTLTVMAARPDGLDPAYGVDAFYAGLARTMKKPVISLETPEQQVALLKGSTPKESQAIVEEALMQLEANQVRPMLNRIATVWAESRYDELTRYADWCDCLKTPRERDLMKRALDDRNPRLADAIDSIHAGGRRAFAAVGSLHMIGPKGVPALLAQRGYAVQRIELKRPAK